MNSSSAASCSGEAVRGARLETLAQYPDTSTWGAFQCYGSPEYRLRSTVSSGASPILETAGVAGELNARLRSLAERAGGARGGTDGLAKEFDTQKG